ncbi:MAG: hypothetical protein ACFCVD_01220 [Nodosilinea sp.]
MAPKKLTEADKTAILSLYRQPQETTSTLAERYGVSNSTISRLLKGSLPELEYSALIQQKRSTGDRGAKLSPSPGEPVTTAAEPAASPAPAAIAADPPKAAPVLKPRIKTKAPAVPETAADDPQDVEEPSQSSRRRRTRSAPDPAAIDLATPDLATPDLVTAAAETATQLSLPQPAEAAPAGPGRPVLKSAQAQAMPLAAEDDLADLNDDWDGTSSLDDDYDEDEDDEDDEESGYTWEGNDTQISPHLGILEIYPLTESVLPALCYVVVERVSSELVALPLRTFAELGQIPEAEGDSRTLPVFDNHRIARRFSRRNQRVIKVPDGTLLQTTSPYLQAKGITRLLIDGQVFALADQTVTVD